MSQTVSRHVSPSSTLSGCSGSSSSEAASSPIPQLSPATDSACGRIDTTPPINTSIIFPLDSLPNLSLDAARVTSDVYSMVCTLSFSSRVVDSRVGRDNIDWNKDLSIWHRGCFVLQRVG
ncbi:hypothetical protein EV363DRAFT_1304958 [Boletus edulis]|nr:hypothetical protein EV363DRAFT_1304958 [Boletus edulis]